MSIFQQYNNTIEELIHNSETFASTIRDAAANKDRLRPGRVKINTDGASNRDDNRSTVAGVIWDSHDNWVKSNVNLSSSMLIKKINEVTRHICSSETFANMIRGAATNKDRLRLGRAMQIKWCLPSFGLG
ncbi:hypothetical protein GOBAR_AA22115 [Gossypium barbadense]|uniref:Uncharacterized protein n=1 Tax=Gossypium barbadense TaxID=3634 RepID=A0A2P5X5F2_GOSBA|nr:hypothetical protein GOBAR_AA22115 [Gossypium barbadense]